MLELAGEKAQVSLIRDALNRVYRIVLVLGDAVVEQEILEGIRAPRDLTGVQGFEQLLLCARRELG